MDPPLLTARSPPPPSLRPASLPSHCWRPWLPPSWALTLQKGLPPGLRFHICRSPKSVRYMNGNLGNSGEVRSQGLRAQLQSHVPSRNYGSESSCQGAPRPLCHFLQAAF